MNSYIIGQIKRIIFRGDNNYIIGVIKIKDTSNDLEEYKSREVTFTGYFVDLNDIDNYQMYGKFIEHVRYGTQFESSKYERLKPEEKDSIVEFLSSDLFKGIGKKKAEKIVKVLGNKALDIILKEPEKLLQVPTISKQQVDSIYTTLTEYESSYNTILYLTDMGFNTKDAMLIYNKFKKDSEKVISRNIYEAFYQVNDISFRTVDRIAFDNRYSTKSKRRISAAIFYAFNEKTNVTGYSYFGINEIYKFVNNLLHIEVSEEKFISSLNDLILNLKVLKKDDRYYLTSTYEAEENIAKRIKYLTNLKNEKYKSLDKDISLLEEFSNIKYDDIQTLAIKRALEKNFLVITGGPGSGKTTIIKSIIDLYQTIHKYNTEKTLEHVALLAPTGRASKRVSEATNLPASTIHRFLKWNKELNKFAVNEYNKSDVDFVIIDESSMVDIFLFDSLLKGLRVDTKIILVGDYNQLPSVGPGQLLRDIIDSGRVEVISLKKVYRQKEGSTIIDFAYQFNEGIIDEKIFKKSYDLTFVETRDMLRTSKMIASDYVSEDFKKFQVLAPMYKTLTGIDNLNRSLQKIFNPPSPDKNEVFVDEDVFREGDKVLQLTNMPEDNVFNGDIGIIDSIDTKSITVDFDGNLVKYTPSNYKKLMLAYAISVHKAQGSEFDTVLLLVSRFYSKMLYRKLYYTAITRAKKRLILVGEVNALRIATETYSFVGRRTTLKDMLIEKIKIDE